MNHIRNSALTFIDHHQKEILGGFAVLTIMAIALVALAHYGMLQKAWRATAHFAHKDGVSIQNFTKPWQVKVGLIGGAALILLGVTAGLVAYKMNTRKPLGYKLPY